MNEPTEPQSDEATRTQVDADPRRLVPQPHGGALLPPPRPGEVRNPNGRPPDAERMVRLLLRRHPDSLSDAVDAWASVLRDPGNRHWLGALREALDRIEGPVTKAHAHHVSTDRAVVVHGSTPHPPSLP